MRIVGLEMKNFVFPSQTSFVKYRLKKHFDYIYIAGWYIMSDWSTGNSS